MLIFPAKAEAVAIGFTIFGILPTPNSAAILRWGRIFAFSLFPQPFFTKTLIYLILLNNLAFPEKANKGDRSMRWFGAVQPQLQGERSKLCFCLCNPASTAGRRLARTCPPRHLPS
ncbi:hypothetical protein QUA28_03315 [Microcoleus sp. Pol14C4]